MKEKTSISLPQLLQDRVMIPGQSEALVERERGLLYNREEQQLVGSDCVYPVYDGIPSFIEPEKLFEGQNWNPWRLDSIKMMENSYYRIARGELPEKEASKSYARYLKKNNLYNLGDTILDFGCASGHFLRSLRGLLDKDVFYTGVDSNFQALQWGAEVFGVNEHVNFLHADVLHLPLRTDSFDISLVNLFHFFPRIDEALSEALRVTKNYLVWRTPIGITNYVVKITHMEHGFDELGVLTPDRNDFDHYSYMLYSRTYLEDLVGSLNGQVLFFDRDTDFGSFDNTMLSEFENVPSTKVVGDLQINGNLVLDWHYIVIKKCE